ncbi:MAG: helix-turn-helix transcriptional regulator [Clostridia bacterium]|nr:helix-turn-helix transcriptional regulator [Clostridia bacterium]
MVDFGNRLKQLRLREGYTQQQLADKLGVTKSVVSYYELQERYPSPDILIRLAHIFRVTTDFLLGLEHKELIDLGGLDEEDIITVKRMISALQKKN